MPRFQRDFHLQGARHRIFVSSMSFVVVCSFSSLYVSVFQLVDDMSLSHPHEAGDWLMSPPPLVFSLLFPEWRLSSYPSPKNVLKCILC